MPVYSIYYYSGSHMQPGKVRSSVDRALSSFDRLRPIKGRDACGPRKLWWCGSWLVSRGNDEVMVLPLPLEHIGSLVVLCICHIQHVSMVDPNPTINYLSYILQSSHKFRPLVLYSTIICAVLLCNRKIPRERNAYEFQDAADGV